MQTRPATGGAAPVFPPGRYGRRRAPRRTPRWLPVVLVAAVVAVMVALALRLYGQYGDPTYDVAVTRVTELADDHVTVEFAVTVPTGGAADCTVRALAYSGAEVGRARVEVRAAPGERQVVTSYRLATSQRAYHADVPGCGPATSR